MNLAVTNIIANFAGRFTAAILGIVFVPLYLRYLNVEVYGLIGFFSSIQAFLFILDGGISPTLNREVARLVVFPEKAQELRDLSRTLEIVCWSTGFGVCIISLLVCPLAATYWLKSDNLTIEIIRESLMLMSVTLAFQWAVTFYVGGLYGLQEQKALNAINVVVAVVRSVGAFLVLAYVSSTIRAFLLWQLFSTLLNCLLLAALFWRKLPPSISNSTFQLRLLKEVWKYAAGMTGISVTVLILTQTDKIILSKLLSLKQFGYYSLATTIAGTGLGVIVGSIQTAYYPQFSQLVAQSKSEELRRVYHQACQVMSLFLIPAVAVLALFSHRILLIWTHNDEIADNANILLSLVAIGTGLNGLMHLPYYAQLAFGVTKLGFWQNIVTILVLIPAMIYASINYGAVGGMWSWVAINFSATIFGMQIMNQMLLQGELRKWYLIDNGLPIVVTLIVLIIGKTLIYSSSGTALQGAFSISILSLVAIASLALTLPEIRTKLFALIKSQVNK